MSHNEKLELMLKEVEKTADEAKKEEDFKKAFALLKDFSQGGAVKIAHDNSRLWLASAILACIAGVIFAAFYFLPFLYGVLPSLYEVAGEDTLGTILFLSGIGLCIGGVIPIVVALTRDGSLDSISDKIFEKDVWFDNNLSRKKVENGHALYSELYGEFGEFRGRGDESRYIKRMVHGAHQGEEFPFEYDYYVFHYVEVYYVTVPVFDSKGRMVGTRTERRTRTCYRYGLLLDFDFGTPIAIVSDGGEYEYPAKWETASQEFNGNFSVYAESEIEAAKFLKPAVLPVVMAAKNNLSDLNIEISKNKRMNIAFSDSDVLHVDRKHSIKEPEAFEQEINSMLGLPKLKDLLQCVEGLKKYNDSNF